jgi:pimeloyl-ACP methyl ester carboxylesterase
MQRHAPLLAFGALLGTCFALAGTLSHPVFTDYSPLSTNLELARRSLSPLTAAQLPRILTQSGTRLSEQPIDLSQETFVLYVPSPAPPQGYALLVFVPPWHDARLPVGWTAVLDRYHVIFVSAARSGNEETVLGRREPLALLAEHNVLARYPVDPQRVYLAGFSGGARVAQRLALAYPDVFRGAILNAGSDPIGDADIALPPRDLFLQFQSSSRLVYLTGEADLTHLEMAAVSMRSMRKWCVFDTDAEVISRTGRSLAAHEVADSAALSRALEAMLRPARPDPEKLASCRSGLDSELLAKLQQVDSLIATGKAAAAQESLKEIDRRFGGLAAPHAVELAGKIELLPK